MPQTSSTGNNFNAFSLFSSESIKQTPSYPLYFLANLDAILAKVLVGAIPREIGIPVPFPICLTIFLQYSVSCSDVPIPLRSRNASSIEYTSILGEY